MPGVDPPKYSVAQVIVYPSLGSFGPTSLGTGLLRLDGPGCTTWGTCCGVWPIDRAARRHSRRRTPRMWVSRNHRVTPWRVVYFAVHHVPAACDELIAQLVGTLDDGRRGDVGFRNHRVTRGVVLDAQHQLTGKVLHRAPQLVIGDSETPQHEAARGHFGEQRGVRTTGERLGHWSTEVQRQRPGPSPENWRSRRSEACVVTQRGGFCWTNPRTHVG